MGEGGKGGGGTERFDQKEGKIIIKQGRCDTKVSLSYKEEIKLQCRITAAKKKKAKKRDKITVPTKRMNCRKKRLRNFIG